jgi:hypothetical protein
VKNASLRDYRLMVGEDCLEQVELKINVVLGLSTGDEVGSELVVKVRINMAPGLGRGKR